MSPSGVFGRSVVSSIEVFAGERDNDVVGCTGDMEGECCKEDEVDLVLRSVFGAGAMRDLTVCEDRPISQESGSTRSLPSSAKYDFRLFLPRVAGRGEAIGDAVDDPLVAYTAVRSREGPAGEDDRTPRAMGSKSFAPATVEVDATLVDELLSVFGVG